MRRTIVAATISGTLLVAAATAWACTPQPRSFAMSPKVAAPGALAEVVGQGVPPNAPVKVHWNDLDANVIGAATSDANGQFKAAVTIPDVSPGVYTVVFVARDPTGTANSAGSSSVGRLPFTVSGPAGRAPALVGSPAGMGSSTGDGPGAIAGIGLLGVGGVIFAGGALLAVAGRRRARADA